MRRLLVLGALIAGSFLALAGTALGAPRLYVSAYGAGPTDLVAGLNRGADGSLTPIAASPFLPSSGPPFSVGGLDALAFTPDGSRGAAAFLAAGTQGFSLSAAGALAPAGSPIPTASVTGLAITPDGRFAYTPTREFGTPAKGILAYSVGANGALTAIPMASGSDEFYEVAITPNGRFLYSIDSTTNKVARFAINADGTLSPLGGTTIAGATTLAVSPDGRFLFVGMESAGTVASFSIATDGSLTQNGAPAPTGSSAMKFFAVAPDGAHIYMPNANVDAIVTAAVAANGTLSVVGSTPIVDPEAIAASPDGHFIYIYHRGPVVGVASAAIGVGGVPTILPKDYAWDSGEPVRPVIQPEPTPVASFTAKAATAGVASQFNAQKSTGATRYEWNFGDGTVLSDGGVAPSHTFAQSGVYAVRLTVFDQQGCSTQQVYTGQSTTCPGGAAAAQTVSLDTPPAISGLKVTNRRFAVAAAKGTGASNSKVKLGTAFRYTLSEAASVRFKIDRRLRGRVVGGKCKPLSAANGKPKHCVLFKKASPPVNAKGKQGANKTPYSGRRKGGKALAPGSYRATVIATDPAGGRSEPRYVSFKVVAG